MIKLIIQILFVLSGGGMLLMVVRKIPVLAELEETSFAPSLKEKSKREDSFWKRLDQITWPSYRKFLHKILSKIRILSLKIERKTSTLLQKLREEAKKKQEIEKNDKYWERLKESTQKRDDSSLRGDKKDS